jgi:hypothetical protein
MSCVAFTYVMAILTAVSLYLLPDSDSRAGALAREFVQAVITRVRNPKS